MRLRTCLAVLPFACVAMFAQTASPVVAPGLTIPSGSGGIPLALDQYEGKSELVPVHHSTVEINNHTGSNIAGSLVFAKQKVTVELAGAHARTVLHDTRPAFFVHLMEDTDSAGDTANSDSSVWAVVRANGSWDRRVFAKIQFTQLTGHAKRADGLVETATERLPGGWLKITPTAALTPGEYAISPVPRTPNTFASVIFDFTLDPAAPNAADAIMAKP